MQHRSVADIVEDFHRRGPEVAYVSPRGYRRARWTYARVAEKAAGLARELEARGVAKGARVFLWGENSAEWVAALFACALRGAVVVPMDRSAAPDFARRVARETQARLALCSRELAGEDLGCPVLALEDVAETVSAGWPPSPAALDPHDTLEIVFTSGSTADPKGVVVTHANVLSNLEPLETEVKKYLKYEWPFHPLRFLNLLPLSHVFGQFLGVFVPQLLGGTVIFQDSLSPSDVLHTIRSERVSVLVAVPRMLQSLREKVLREEELAGRLDDFSKNFKAAEGSHALFRWWRFRRIHTKFGWKFWAFVSGGATLDAETEEFWRRLGFVVIQGYGLTETTSLISINHPFAIRAGAIGKVLPGREFKLSAEGEILVRGSGVAAGYWQGRDVKPVEAKDGWFHTGDCGELDAGGHLFFKGRLKDVIVTPEGLNVFPEDLEAALRRDPAVRDCVVVGLERNGNAEPCAAVVLRDSKGGVGRAVQNANRSLAPHQQIRRWVEWPEEDFPRTPTQKPRKAEVLAKVRSLLDARAPQAVTADSRHQTLAGLIGAITGRGAVSLKPESNLAEDLNLSSLERVELLSAIEDRYQVEMNESKFAAATTVADLEAMFREAPARRTDYAYPRWAQSWPVTWIRLAVYYLLSWPATVLLGYPRLRGRENLRDVRGPVLVVSNHITSVDIGFILAALPARFRHRAAVAMQGERLRGMRHPSPEQNFFLRWVDQISYALVVALFNVFPLPQKTGFRESFKFAGESVDRGYSVVVFPEGSRTQDGRLATFQAGVGLLVAKLGVPVVPMRIDGLFELKKAGKRVTRPHVVRVSIGQPVTFPPQTQMEEIARELEKRVRGLEWT